MENEILLAFLETRVARLAQLVQFLELVADKHKSECLAQLVLSIEALADVSDDVGLVCGLLPGQVHENPRMLQQLGRGRPATVVDVQTLENEVFCVVGNMLPILVVENHKIVAAHLVEKLLWRLGPDRRVASYQNERNDAQRPYIAGHGVAAFSQPVQLAVALGCIDLGSNVAVRARHSGEFLRGGLSQLSRDTKVRKHHGRLVVRREIQHVFRFDVSVDNSVAVQVINGREQLVNDVAGVGLGEGGLLDESVEQLASCRQLGHDVEIVLCFEPVQQPDYVVVLDGLENLDFAQNGVQMALEPRLENDLDGHGLACFLHHSLSHSAKRACSKRFQKLVLSFLVGVREFVEQPVHTEELNK
ncbi:hypothetical protein OGATHE_004977 [Ogataea polymorpha]|uniref:Uncharacterized protein n=1 Tax=Ogataea polymorpha TaxID=460523 RepID=A0A9P8NVT5_9ASCO|nr:hypothetical protein OGATHE_004977 [Ogataea polymorpha]